MRVSTVQQMREMDKKAVELYGIPELLLMENAGNAAVQLLKNKFPADRQRVLVVCGPGNNGGDGFVIARLLFSEQCRVTVLIAAEPNKYQGSALINLEMLQKLGVERQVVQPDLDIKTFVQSFDVIVDALFGTGLTRPPENLHAQIIAAINESHKPVLSVDIPSGINGDTGQIMQTAVRAAWTITFGLPKIGLLLYPGYQHTGEITVSHISFPAALYDSPELRCRINAPISLPPRPVNGHKGTFGQALFIAGAQSYYGAPFFSAESFLKAGGGYARLACPRSLAPIIAAKASEIVFAPMYETPDGSLSLKNRQSLLDFANASDFVVLGPGISLQEETQNLACELVTQINKPLLIDGDGLTALSGRLYLLASRTEPVILTPHRGEMIRLLDGAVEQLETNPIETARSFSEKWNAYLVLKGAHTIIACPDGEIFINLTGNSGMATAGSGDVLTGAIAAMYGLGLNIPEAVRMGVLLHGFAGDLAAGRTGEDGLTAADILNALPEALQLARAGEIGMHLPVFGIG
jgi:hydroxyethylthiazole kinase-like uncharacterized protein yjeF